MGLRHQMRRLLWLLIGETPVVGVIASAASGPRPFASTSSTIGYALLAVSAYVGGTNAYLSWIRPALHRTRNDTREGLRFVSPVPIVSTIGLGGIALVPRSIFVTPV